MISLIVAIAENDAIGKNNDLLWHISGDLRRFKRITRGHPVIMGKKTYESLPRRPLPERRNIVITDLSGETIEGCEMAYSIRDAVNLCDPAEENFIIGGASVYGQFLPLADRLYITRVHKTFEADVFFPPIDPGIWELTAQEPGEDDPELDFQYTYEIYDRRK